MAKQKAHNIVLLDLKSRERQLQPKQSKLAAPEGQKGWDITVLGVGAGQDGAWGKARGFLLNICFSPSPVHAHSPPSWKNPDPFECGGVAM